MSHSCDGEYFCESTIFLRNNFGHTLFVTSCNLLFDIMQPQTIIHCSHTFKKQDVKLWWCSKLLLTHSNLQGDHLNGDQSRSIEERRPVWLIPTQVATLKAASHRAAVFCKNANRARKCTAWNLQCSASRISSERIAQLLLSGKQGHTGQQTGVNLFLVSQWMLPSRIFDFVLGYLEHIVNDHF